MKTILVFLLALNSCLLACHALTDAEMVKVLAASYSYGGDFADVTARVKSLLAEGKTFQANPGCCSPIRIRGWNKALVIFSDSRQTVDFLDGRGRGRERRVDVGESAARRRGSTVGRSCAGTPAARRFLSSAMAND